MRTRVGYAGGTKENPSYYDLGGHSETIQIDYDPAQISYKELLDIFWRSHSPTARPWSRQYASVIFYHNEQQRRLAVETREHEAAGQGAEVFTEIVPYTEFYPAEGYHQKYRLRQATALWEALLAIYPDETDLINSTAAARLNGYAGGYGSFEVLETEINDLGLSPGAKRSLLEAVSRRNP